ncbi:hypothetical protein EPJ79_10535 [Brachyspira aalborgi]|uniref:Uncharacterized protein n=1 Tax=Brachyspira aalborgi TaxID=29522 RepID=A0A5C8D8D9_9SPIR|nr:hypothetical protein [Brachyspira aalborgi]TXJ21530.1 hypothetical protein EPJ79_10535 [Brachyspira aalborgi]
MKSKSKNLFLKIYIPFVIVTIIALVVLQILGSKKRVGYLTDFKLNVAKTLELNNLNIYSFTEEGFKNYLLTNDSITNCIYGFRIRYYDKVFRNSDIYGVYPDLSNLPDYMKNAEMDEGGSPYGNFISDKKEIEKKIDNINYILKIKINFIIILAVIILTTLCIYLLSPYLIEIANILIENDFNDNNFNFTNKILNIAFYIYIILLSIIILSSNLFTIITVDDWVYSSNWGLYNIYNFYGYFWHRGRHFVEILIALSMRPFGNILISFGIEPFYALKISNAVFILIYYYLISISVSLFIWILNNKRNYKLTWLTTFLFTLCLTGLKGNWTFLAAYIASAGIALLIWLPMLYYFIYEKEFILGRNKILYYSIFTYLIYFATFTIEPTSLTISGLSLFILIYYINIDKKIFAENHSSKPKKYIIFFLILFIISTVIAFLLTLFSGRGQTQIKVVDNSSPINNIINAFADFGIFEKFLILFAVIYIIFLISKFIKLKKISKIDYICFSVLFVALLGIFGFSAIKLTTSNILLEFLLIFIVLLLILLKNINNKTIWNAISSFIIIGLIIIMGMQVYIDYDNHFKSSFYKDGKSDYKLLQLFIEADKLGNSEIILTKEDIKNLSLESHNIKNYSEELPNIYISNWMLYYGYTKKLILIRVED